MTKSKPRLELAETIQELRQELAKAVQASEGQRLKFASSRESVGEVVGFG